MSLAGEFTKGIWKENPIFKLALGLCPTLAVTTSFENGLGMGLSATFVLLCSNILIAVFKNIIPSKIRIPVYIVVIASFVTIVELFTKGFVPDLYKSLGIFIPLIVVNCVILGRAEAFASKNSVMASIVDALGMGAGFTLTLCLIGFIRELLGAGTIIGYPVFGPDFKPMIMAILAPGGFITLGLLLAFFRMLEMKKK